MFIAVSRCANELKIPITCKIRIFDDVQRTVEYVKMLERAGAKVHDTVIAFNICKNVELCLDLIVCLLNIAILCLRNFG